MHFLLFSLKELASTCAGTLVANDVWKFGLSSNKPHSLHDGLSLIMVHGDLPVIWPFHSVYTVPSNSE